MDDPPLTSKILSHENLEEENFFLIRKNKPAATYIKLSF